MMELLKEASGLHLLSKVLYTLQVINLQVSSLVRIIAETEGEFISPVGTARSVAKRSED